MNNKMIYPNLILKNKSIRLIRLLLFGCCCVFLFITYIHLCFTPYLLAQNLGIELRTRVKGTPQILVNKSLQDTFPCPITWSPAQQISDDSTDAFYPQIAQSGDTIHVTYYGDYGRGIRYTRSTDNGISWSVPVQLVPADSIGESYTGIIASSGPCVYLAYTHRKSSDPPPRARVKVLISSDAGSTWTTSVIADTGSPRRIKTFRDTVYIYYLDSANRPAMMKSVDFGSSWTRLTQIQIKAYNIEVDKNGIHMVAELPDIEVRYYRSSDFGHTWSSGILLSTPDNMTSDEPAIASNGDSVLFVAWRDGKYGSIGGFAAAILSRRSTDGGITWENEVRHDSLPAGNFPLFAIKDNRIILAWDDERVRYNLKVVYRFSSNGGTSWCSENTLAPSKFSQGAIRMTYENNRVHATWIRYYGPYQHRIFYCHGDATTTDVRENLQITQLFEIGAYPNPFNSSTKVVYTILRDGDVDLSVYDIIGRKVFHTYSKQLAGKHEITFNARNLLSGVYIVHLRTANELLTTKVLLLK